MQRLSRTILATLLTASTVAAGALVAAPAQTATPDSPRASSPTFTWEGTWDTSLWGPAKAAYHVGPSLPGQPAEPSEKFSFSWVTGGYSNPGDKSGLAGLQPRNREDDFFGSWSETTLSAGTAAPTETGGLLRLVPATDGRSLTGAWTNRADNDAWADFSATCTAGPCMSNNISPAGIQAAEDEVADAATVPLTALIRGLENVKRPATSKYAFKVYRKLVNPTFECRLDSGKWTACTSPYVLKTKSLRVGKHILRVRGIYRGNVDKSPSKKYITVR